MVEAMKINYIVEGKPLWKHAVEFNDASSDQKRDANLRTIKQDEMVLDCDSHGDNKNTLSSVIVRLDNDKLCFLAYKHRDDDSGHIHLTFSDLKGYSLKERNRLRELFINHYNCDPAKSSESTFISTELKPHFKTGKIKEKAADFDGINTLPAWLIEEFSKTPGKRAVSVDEITGGNKEGNRNLSLFRLATLYRKAKATEEETLILAAAENEKNDPPLTEREVRNIVSSAYRTDSPYAIPFEGEVDYTHFFDGNTFISKRMADKIKESFIFKTMMDNDEIYVYQNGVYKPKAESIIKKMCNDLLGDHYNTHRGNETVGFIQASTYTERVEPDMNLINLSNGIYNIKTGLLLPHDPEIFMLTQHPFDYEPGADCPTIKTFISEVVREEDIDTIQELFGYCLWKKYHIQKAFVFLGEGNNGKSTLLELLKAFIGVENVSGISLQDLEGRFTPASLYGKLANIYADLSDRSLKQTGKFKMVTGGDNIGAEQKFKDFFNFVNYAKLIYSANKLPECDDDTTAFFRRWIFVSCPNSFEPGKCDPDILEKLTTDSELSGLFNWALVGLRRLLKNKMFSSSKTTEETRRLYIQMSSPVVAFVESEMEFEVNAAISKDEIYSRFVKYCNKTGLPTVPSNIFAMRIKQKYPTVSISRKLINAERINCWIGMKLAK